MLKADVLKAGHHGSSTSTSDAFLKRCPSWVVIQCGKGNSYGHPHKETMEKLKKAGCQVLRTDEEGTITAFSDGKRNYMEYRHCRGSWHQRRQRRQSDSRYPRY